MGNRLIVIIAFIILLVLAVFSCQNNKEPDRSIKDDLETVSQGLEDCMETGKIYNYSYIDKMRLMEKQLVESELLARYEASCYKQLIFLLINSDFNFEKEFFEKNELAYRVINNPATMGHINSCFHSYLDSFDNNAIAPDIENITEVGEILNNYMNEGTYDNWPVINNYFEFLDKNQFNKFVYRTFAIYLVCAISENKKISNS